MRQFEFDPAKSEVNLEKHGIDFPSAQRLWDDPDLIEIQAKSADEDRFLLIGRIGEKHWSAVVTYRNEKTRIISVRRSRKKEVDVYEG
ncbi:BrnT family toxin [Allohahella marinimesophila]|uniref:BrnT family toxin n=1 Tax=Allohahella marinimesophila TaxID=1054972 RepID=A0ABP7PHS7_9GAMM